MASLPNITYPNTPSVLDYARWAAGLAMQRAPELDEQMRRRRGASILADVQSGKLPWNEAMADPEGLKAIRDQLALEVKLGEYQQQKRLSDAHAAYYEGQTAKALSPNGGKPNFVPEPYAIGGRTFLPTSPN